VKTEGERYLRSVRKPGACPAPAAAAVRWEAPGGGFVAASGSLADCADRPDGLSEPAPTAMQAAQACRQPYLAAHGISDGSHHLTLNPFRTAWVFS
jgi:hypothetical protein